MPPRAVVSGWSSLLCLLAEWVTSQYIFVCHVGVLRGGTCLYIQNWSVAYPELVCRRAFQTSQISMSSSSSSRSISSSGRRCPLCLCQIDAFLRHSAYCCHHTKRIWDVFVPSLSWVSSASFPGYIIPCIIVFSKPLRRVTLPKYLSFWRLTKLYSQFFGRWSSFNIEELVRWAIHGIRNILR